MITRVLITSDTHLARGAQLPNSLLALAERADHIIHAGDLTSLDVHTVLVSLAPVTAVYGNVDDGDISATLGEHAEVEIAGVRFGVVHIPGASAGRHERLVELFPDCDVIVYGHTHMPELERTADGRVLIVNPGSPTQRRRAPGHSACWLELEAGAVRTSEIVWFDHESS